VVTRLGAHEHRGLLREEFSLLVNDLSLQALIYLESESHWLPARYTLLGSQLLQLRTYPRTCLYC